MESFTEEDWLNELREFYPQEQPRSPGDFTAAEYAEREGISHKVAGDRLYLLWQEGKLTRERGNVDGHACFIYSKKG